VYVWCCDKSYPILLTSDVLELSKLGIQLCHGFTLHGLYTVIASFPRCPFTSLLALSQMKFMNTEASQIASRAAAAASIAASAGGGVEVAIAEAAVYGV
jgi:hypothetical protein